MKKFLYVMWRGSLEMLKGCVLVTLVLSAIFFPSFLAAVFDNDRYLCWYAVHAAVALLMLVHTAGEDSIRDERFK